MSFDFIEKLKKVAADVSFLWNWDETSGGMFLEELYLYFLSLFRVRLALLKACFYQRLHNDQF